MHIGFLTPEYPHKTEIYGGIATSIKTLALALIEEGHTVTVFLYGREEDGIDLDEKIRIISIKMKKTKGFTWWTNRKYIQSVINKEVEQNNLQLLEAPDWTGITAFMKLHCPLLIRLHGSDTYFCHIEKRHQKYKNYFFEKTALKGADYIVSVSGYTAGLTKTLFGLTTPMKVIHNGIDVNAFTSRASGLSTRQDSILYLGTIIRKKGVLELASIFNEVIKEKPNARLVLVGADASDVSTGSISTWKLMQEVFSEDALKQVDYLGKVPHDKILEHIDGAAMCVFPSFAEAFPISWLEAMACKKPIVASNIGWASECIEDEKSGLLESPTRHLEYAKKIVHLLNDKKWAEELASNTYKQVKSRFDISVIAKQNITYYEYILKERKI